MAKCTSQGYVNGEGESRGIWRIKGIRLWMNQSCYSLGLSLKILSGCSLHFVDIKVFIVGYVRECEKSFFCKIWGFGESLATRTSHEF